MADDGARPGTQTAAARQPRSPWRWWCRAPIRAAPSSSRRHPPQSGLLILQSVDYDSDGPLIIGGQAPPGEEVRAYLDNRYLGVAKADSAGRWHIKPDDLVAAGPAQPAHR